MGWNLDTSIKGAGTGAVVARNYASVNPYSDIGPGGGVRMWAWSGLPVPTGATRVQVTASTGARAGANAAGFYYLYMQTPDGVTHQLSAIRFHNMNLWWNSWNHTLMGTRPIPHGGTVNFWIDMHNDAGSGSNAFARRAHFSVNWFA